MIKEVSEASKFSLTKDVKPGVDKMFINVQLGLNLEYTADEQTDENINEIKKIMLNNLLHTIVDMGKAIEKDFENGRETNAREQAGITKD